MGKPRGGGDLNLVNMLKTLTIFLSNKNCDLKIKYIKSKDNPADAPSRRISEADSRLTTYSWGKVQDWFGPHTFDLMSLDSNCMKNAEGQQLPHFTPWPLPESSGVNVFCQHLTSEHNYYVFPPFNMVGAMVSFLLHDCRTPLYVSIVVPKPTPTPAWWPLLIHKAKTHRQLGEQGRLGIVENPSQSGFKPSNLRWDLWVVRLEI